MFFMEEYTWWAVPDKLLHAKWSHYEVSVVYEMLLIIMFSPTPPPQKLKTTLERGTLALSWEFSWEEPKSWKSLQNAKSEYEKVGGEKELNVSDRFSVFAREREALKLLQFPMRKTARGITINIRVWQRYTITAKLRFHRDPLCPSRQMFWVGTFPSVLNSIRG